MLEHVGALHEFYGEFMGPRIARKHLGWYVETLPHGRPLRRAFNALQSAEAQISFIQHPHFFDPEVLAA